VCIVEFRTFRNRLSERNSGFTSNASDVIFTPHPLDVDIEVKLAHSGNDGFLGLVIDVDSECGVFLLESVERARKIGGFISFRSDREGNDGFGNIH
jgi:hypothetical protein